MEKKKVTYSEICPCNPANGGSGICGCTMGNQLVNGHKDYTVISTTSTNIDMPTNKKTAVEWLVENLQAPCRGIPSHIIEQAKAMEKEQLSNAFYAPTDIQTSKNFEDYYNENYGKETNSSTMVD